MIAQKPNANETPKARARLARSHMTAEKMAALTHRIAESIQQHPELPKLPEMQSSLSAWAGLADSLDKGVKAIQANRTALGVLFASEAREMAAWQRMTNRVIALVNDAAGGHADQIRGWGFDVAGRQAPASTKDPPASLRATYAKGSLALVVKWSGVRGNRGYLLSIGDGTPEGWGSPIPCPRASHSPEGLTPGQKATFRVAVLRSNGISDWSQELSLIIR